jgi:hypothetical protein
MGIQSVDSINGVCKLAIVLLQRNNEPKPMGTLPQTHRIHKVTLVPHKQYPAVFFHPSKSNKDTKRIGI